MAIQVDEVVDISGATRANQSGIAWAVWSGEITAAPAESGSGLSTDGNGALTIPSTATSGYFMLRVSNSLMGIYSKP